MIDLNNFKKLAILGIIFIPWEIALIYAFTVAVEFIA